ncbi:hypothetical protein AM1_6066 [Acaryochloris marina MBIC11017]|uniref:Uncharacterized protein n=1 Tax=Acaryochloris marina (strain MBIC 11017) TaxID=329726 RepID=B0C3R1_ACAM1|nr:hypothetical protein AM1_6066 [Acaryochloris marina MBIC11017]
MPDSRHRWSSQVNGHKNQSRLGLESSTTLAFPWFLSEKRFVKEQ